MIRNPRLGQMIRMHYRRESQSAVTTEGKIGEIVAIGRGKGPRNFAVRFGESIVVVPRGNANMADR